MDGHLSAINSFAVPILCGMIVALLSALLWTARKGLERFFHTIARFEQLLGDHDQRLTRVETKVENIEHTVRDYDR